MHCRQEALLNGSMPSNQSKDIENVSNPANSSDNLALMCLSVARYILWCMLALSLALLVWLSPRQAPPSIALVHAMSATRILLFSQRDDASVPSASGLHQDLDRIGTLFFGNESCPSHVGRCTSQHLSIVLENRGHEHETLESTKQFRRALLQYFKVGFACAQPNACAQDMLTYD